MVTGSAFYLLSLTFFFSFIDLASYAHVRHASNTRLFYRIVQYSLYIQGHSLHLFIYSFTKALIYCKKNVMIYLQYFCLHFLEMKRPVMQTVMEMVVSIQTRFCREENEYSQHPILLNQEWLLQLHSVLSALYQTALKNQYFLPLPLGALCFKKSQFHLRK